MRRATEENFMRRIGMLLGLTVLAAPFALGQGADPFRQLDELWPTPTSMRTASGAPGTEYWQQQVDYEIDVTLDEERHWITGSEAITYHNNSPDTLTYLWVQLDQNNFAKDSMRRQTSTVRSMRRNPVIRGGEITFDTLDAIVSQEEFEGGYTLDKVVDERGAPLKHTINGTMMRVELPKPLASGKTFRFGIGWNYPIPDHRTIGGRAGREYFKDDDNWLYEIAQWFPRLAVYDDVNGWQNKQFMTSEFSLEFGNYEVSITVPDDHVVASTGELQNPKDVLKPEWRERLEVAKDAKQPRYIITPEEAKANESSEPSGTKTWVFKAENVRDFAWASSRKFIWDAQGHWLDDNFTMAMSYWPKEGEPLWSQYSTHSIMQALDIYGRVAFPLPYPVMISVNGPVGGMEYPMITFNGARPEDDGTYGERTKYGLISVIIHEVGHCWFPMIVNTDERQWTWMDEGINTFVQFLAEQEWEDDYPSRRGDPRNLTYYFRDPNKVPIMTDGDSLLQVGNNAYGKPAVALNVLRETVMGRELFDVAFKEYATRWMFKRPEPADFFRTMEDASGVDLDWFWRGWFYGVAPTDIAVERITKYTMDSGDPDIDREKDRQEEEEEAPTVTAMRNASIEKRADRFPELGDFYNEYDEFEVFEDDREKFEEMVAELTDRERELLAKTNLNYYMIEYANPGGLVMPVIAKINYGDESSEILRYPAEIWRYDTQAITKMLVTDKEIVSIEVDPYLETGDIETENNHFPRKIQEKRFKVKPDDDDPKNPMQKAIAREIGDEEEDTSDEMDNEP